MIDDFDFKRKLMDEATEKLNQYVRALVREKKGRQARAFCEEKYPQIALTGFLKRVISARIGQDKENSHTDPGASFDETYRFVSSRLSGKTEVTREPAETDPSECIVIHAGEGVSLRLQRGASGDFEITVRVPADKKSSKSSLTDPDMPDGKEEAAPLMLPPDRLGAFCSAAEYVFDNAHEFREWAGHECWQLWEKYKYIDYPKKDVYDKVPVYWWWAWLENASEKDRSDLAFVKKLVARRGECLQNAPAASKADRSTVLAAIRDFDYAITYASEELQNDRDFVLQAIEANGDVFPYLKERFRDDRKAALRAVTKKGSNLEYVSERLRGDTDIVEAALAHDLSYFRYAAPSFRDNKEYVMRAVAERGDLLAILSERFRADREVVLTAVTSAGTALRYAAENFKNDREIVLAAVKNSGSALEFASDGLRGDREIVFTAIENHWAALKYASDELRDDKEIALFALGRDRDAWYFISGRLLADFEIIKAAAAAGGYENLESLPDEMLKNADTVVSILGILSENPPDMDDYGEFADGTSEYYEVFENGENAFCRLVEGLPAGTLKSDPELVGKICGLAVTMDSAYYDEGTNPHEFLHTRLPDRLKEFFEAGGIPYSDAITKAIEAREAQKYHPREYGEDIPPEESLFLEAGDYYEWLAEKIRNEDGPEAFAEYLGPQGSWSFHVMVRFVKSLIANREGLFHDDELWQDEDYEVDLDKAYEEIKKRLSSKMEVISFSSVQTVSAASVRQSRRHIRRPSTSAASSTR